MSMHADCEFCIKRYICTKDVPKPCKYRYTEEERIADQASDNYGAILNGTYLHKTFRKKEEDNEMKATSVQNIKNVKGVSFSFERYPIEMESKLTIIASTDDDIFEFEFEGPDLLQSCRAAGLFTGWEKDQKIKELEKELGEWKKEASECLRLRDEFRREKNRKINELKQQLQQAEYDKKRLTWKNERLKEENVELIKENEKFEKVSKEWEKEPTSRRDILKAAEMCVCGQREQDYGTPESNFQLIADLWNDYLKKEKSSIVVDSMDVAMMMALLKIARIKNGGGSGDSFVDLAGYAACGGEIWYGGKTQVPEGE